MGSPGNSVNSFNSATAGSTGVSAIVCTRRFTRREGGGVKERKLKNSRKRKKWLFNRVVAEVVHTA
jgi:hypothetical protein